MPTANVAISHVFFGYLLCWLKFHIADGAKEVKASEVRQGRKVGSMTSVDRSATDVSSVFAYILPGVNMKIAKIASSNLSSSANGITFAETHNAII